MPSIAKENGPMNAIDEAYLKENHIDRPFH
jgi:hypothetical protein